MNQQEYQEALERRQREHLKQVYVKSHTPWRPCMHNQCTQCHGTGIKLDGSFCVHAISCPCPKCSAR
jgi:hypothetical protein